MRRMRLFVVAGLVVCVLGCARQRAEEARGDRFVMSRPVTVTEAEERLGEARRTGALILAPAISAEAEHRLTLARRDGVSPDSTGDIEMLATEAAVQAAGRGAEPVGIPERREACRAMLDSTREAFGAFTREQVSRVSAAAYGRLRAELAWSRDAMREGAWRDAAPVVAGAAATVAALERVDSDKDGVPDVYDGAHLAPEDYDGFEDDDGAPDLDNDRDGIPDALDAEPDLPETVNGWRDRDGAPDEYPDLRSLFFDSASSEVRAGERGFLAGLALVFEAQPALALRVAGHTDDRLTMAESLRVSRARAENVRDLLVSHGLEKERVTVVFFGKSRPVQSNETVRGRAANRRVELSFDHFRK